MNIVKTDKENAQTFNGLSYVFKGVEILLNLLDVPAITNNIYVHLFYRTIVYCFFPCAKYYYEKIYEKRNTNILNFIDIIICIMCCLYNDVGQ